jgi:hypothetical protein
MYRKITILLLGAAFLPAILLAQVATTDLAPGTARFIHPNALGLNSVTFTPDNPAALAWGKASMVGGGLIQGTFSDNTVPSTQDFDGQYLGFRWVGEFISLAAETHDVEDSDGINAINDESTNIHAAIRLGDFLALGVATEEMKNLSNNVEVDRLTAGVSLAFNEMFYVGAALVQEEEKINVPNLEREGTMIGVAFRSDGDWQWYGAYEVIDLDDFTVLGVTAGGGVKMNTTTLQVNIGNLLLGAAIYNVFPQGTTDDISGKILDIGWAPEEGLNITARMLDIESADPVTGFVYEESEMQSVTVAWLF